MNEADNFCKNKLYCDKSAEKVDAEIPLKKEKKWLYFK
jgi:hypothetical protein